MKDIATVRGQLALVVIVNGKVWFERDHTKWPAVEDYGDDYCATEISLHEISGGYIELRTCPLPRIKESNEAICRLLCWLMS